MVWFWPFLLVFGCFLSTLLTPLSMRLAECIHAIDRPDGVRKAHPCPVPRLGGLAVFLTVVATMLLFLPLSSLHAAWLTGGALLCALGVSDDVFSLPPWLKLLAMTAIAAVPAFFGLSPTRITFGTFSFALPFAFGTVITVLWLLLLTNAYNLIDGLDSLAVSLGIVCALFLAMTATAPSALLLGGGLLGFLPYNRPALHLTDGKVKNLPTRSFLGDTGALFIGYSLGLLSLGEEQHFSLFLPLLFALPLYEVLSSFLRRLWQGKSPFSADGNHLHHRLLKKGYAPFAVVMLLSLYSLLFSSLFFLCQSLCSFG